MTTPLERLAQVAEALQDDVETLRKRTTNQWWYIIAIAAGLVVMSVVVIIVINVYNAQARAREQGRVERTQAICPLYYLFLDQYNQQRRDALPPVEQKKYDDAFVTIRHGAEVLGCKR